MAALLSRLEATNVDLTQVQKTHLRRLLQVLSDAVRVVSAPEALPLVPASEALVESLSRREIDVLRLIAAGHDNAEIAGSLYIAPSTVKTHVNNIFGKLGAASRTHAVARARDLGLI